MKQYRAKEYEEMKETEAAAAVGGYGGQRAKAMKRSEVSPEI